MEDTESRAQRAQRKSENGLFLLSALCALCVKSFFYTQMSFHAAPTRTGLVSLTGKCHGRIEIK